MKIEKITTVKKFQEILLTPKEFFVNLPDYLQAVDGEDYYIEDDSFPEFIFTNDNYEISTIEDHWSFEKSDNTISIVSSRASISHNLICDDYEYRTFGAVEGQSIGDLEAIVLTDKVPCALFEHFKLIINKVELK